MAEFRFAFNADTPNYGTEPQTLSSAERSNVTSTAWAEDFTGVDEEIARQALINEAEQAERTQTIGSGTSSSGGTDYRENPLDQFVNYTYSLTLSANKPGSFSGEGGVMIASGGRRENRSPIFFDDMYFESCRITTVIGLNARTRSSNVIDISFTVVEPYGITLINRLLDIAKSVGAENWTEMSFVLKIDFFGNTEDGMPSGPLSGQTKLIPMKIIGCDMKATVRGSEYKFTGVPYHHAAFNETSGTTPALIEVTAETIKEFFIGGGETDASYQKGLNDYQKKLVKDKYINIADEYEFVIDGSIGSKKVVEKKERNHYGYVPMANENNSSAKTRDGIRAGHQSREDQAPAKLDQKKQVTSINPGTSIIDVINQTIRNSEYITEQVGKGGSGGGPIKWYKIVSDVEIKGYDSKRKSYAKKFIYKILPMEVYNTKYPDAPLAQPPSAQKIYEYLYTGKNQQILDFSLDFNVLFYTAVTASRYKLDELEVPPSNTTSTDDKGITNSTKESDVTPAHTKIVVNQTDVSTLHQGTNSVTNVSANDLYKSLMSTSRGDMINVNLKITGDPEFIKQDDIAYISEGKVGTIDQFGSITTDGGEVYVDLFFRSPRDIDQSTGLYDFSNWQDAAFNGRYRVITVDNQFERGQFTQNLQLVRIFNQDSPSSGGGGGTTVGYGGAGDVLTGDVGNGAQARAEAEVSSEVQRLINRSQTISDSRQSPARNVETSTRQERETSSSESDLVSSYQNRFIGITPEDVSQWNIQ